MRPALRLAVVGRLEERPPMAPGFGVRHTSVDGEQVEHVEVRARPVVPPPPLVMGVRALARRRWVGRFSILLTQR